MLRTAGFALGRASGVLGTCSAWFALTALLVVALSLLPLGWAIARLFGVFRANA